MKLNNNIFFLELTTQNSLKRSFSILKNSGNSIFKAAYSGGANSVHKHLTVKENIEVDILNRVFSKREMSIDNMHERLKRINLYDYYTLLGITNILNKKMSDLKIEQKTLYSHFKAISRGHDVIIFECPEKHLSKESIENLKTCLRSCSLTKPVIIISDNPFSFNSMIDYYIKENKNNIELLENLLKTNIPNENSVKKILPISA